MHIDIFKGDAFEVASLTQAIIDTPFVPTRIGKAGLFTTKPISTTTVSIEKMGQTISLVPAANRGSPGKTVGTEKRQLIPFTAVHLPQRGAVLADEVQNLRAFGKESETELATTFMNQKLELMRANLDLTIEFHRIGAIKGQVLDADGTTVLLDIFAAFGLTQQTTDFILDVTTTKIKQKCIDAKRQVEDALGGLMYTGLTAWCSTSFFDAIVGHAAVEKAYDRYLDSQHLRTDQRRTGFEFCGIQFEEYRGGVSGIDFIADGEAYLVPEGVNGLFVTHYAPADYMETVNTMGLPYYAKRKPMDFDKGVEMEAQSNPLSLCTRPRVIIKLTA